MARVKPESTLILFFACSGNCRASTRPTGERVTFFACAKKDNQRNTPPVARSPGILPSDSARVLRGSPDVRRCTFGERAHIVRALLRTDPTHPRRATGGPVSAASCRRSQDSHFSCAVVCAEVVQGCTASWIPAPFAVPSIAGDGGKCPQGRAHDVRASADSTRTYCQTTPPAPRSAGTRVQRRSACTMPRRGQPRAAAREERDQNQ